MAVELVAIALGLLVGLSLGALGGGGSILAVPILVFIGGLTAQDATTASLLVIGVASVIGVLAHFRHGNVRLGAGLAFGAAGIVGSRVGLLINRSLDENVLLLAFSALIAFVAVRMFRSVGRRAAATKPAEATDAADVSADATPAETPESAGTDGSVATLERQTTDTRRFSAAALAKLAIAASIVGLLTGLFGVGGGFAVVPALVLLLGFPTREAIGTTLVVIAINASIALAMRADGLELDWSIVAPFLATVTVGVIVGTWIATRVQADRLTRSFAVLLGSVALYTALSTILSI